jgi:hypothetical protein
MTRQRTKWRGHNVEVDQNGRIFKLDGIEVPAYVRLSIYSSNVEHCAGGMTRESRRRENARYNGRKGGKASGRKRRQLAKGKRRTRDGRLGVPYAYKPVPRLSRERFDQKFRGTAELAGRRFNQAGCDTTWAMYGVLRRWYDVHGNAYEITTGNLQAALQKLGRPRSRRTVEYVKCRLVEMGLIRRAHVRRSGPRRVPGRMDTCRIWLRRGCLRRAPINCTPPLRGRGKRSFVAQLPSAAQAESGFREPKRPDPPPQPPAAAVPRSEERQAAPPPGTEGGQRPSQQVTAVPRQLTADERYEQSLAFDELKRQAGWTVPRRYRRPDWGEHAAATPELTEPNHGARLDIPRRASDDEEFQRQLEFDELKRRMGWSVPLRVRRPDWGERASP